MKDIKKQLLITNKLLLLVIAFMILINNKMTVSAINPLICSFETINEKSPEQVIDLQNQVDNLFNEWNRINNKTSPLTGEEENFLNSVLGEAIALSIFTMKNNNCVTFKINNQSLIIFNFETEEYVMNDQLYNTYDFGITTNSNINYNGGILLLNYSPLSKEMLAKLKPLIVHWALDPDFDNIFLFDTPPTPLITNEPYYTGRPGDTPIIYGFVRNKVTGETAKCAFKTSDSTSKVFLENVLITASKTIIEIGEKITLVRGFTPSNTTEKALTYSSSDITVATVNTTGVITGLKAGVTTIAVTDANNVVHEIQITVVEENNQLTEKTEAPKMPEENPKTGLNMLTYVVIIIVLGGVGTYLYITNKHKFNN